MLFNELIRSNLKNTENRYTISELSNQTLSQYKIKAALDAGSADLAGNHTRANKRIRGIIKATKKQFTNNQKNKEVNSAQEVKEAQQLDKDRSKVNNCVPLSEECEALMSAIIHQILINETVQNNRR